MSLTMTIAGLEMSAFGTGYLQADSLTISDALNRRNTCGFDLLGPPSARPVIGQEVVILNGTPRAFAGFVEDFSEKRLSGPVARLAYSVNCVDYNAIADRHHVARVYEVVGQTMGDIVIDIVTKDLAGEGITTAYVQDGPLIEKAVFNYQTVAEAFNNLAELTGYSWYIDYNKVLHFFARETNAAPFGLSDSSSNFRNLTVKRNRSQYRNKQIVRAGYDLTDSRTETFKGDGETRSWPLKFPVGVQPTAISVGGVPKTIGIGGVDSGKDFYWNKGDPLIKQDDSGTKLTSANIVSVTYQGMFPIVVTAQDDSAIAAMQAQENGGTGVFEAVTDQPNIDSEEMATAAASGLLRKYGEIPEVVEFETDDDGLAAGQLLPINVTDHGLAGSYLIDNVRASDRDGRTLVYRVKALSGESFGGWEALFKGFAEQGRRLVIRENEVVVLLRQNTQAVTCAEALTYTSAAPERRVGHARVNYSEVG
jgi:hypothetical protein